MLPPAARTATLACWLIARWPATQLATWQPDWPPGQMASNSVGHLTSGEWQNES